jgi:hypothetical protein
MGRGNSRRKKKKRDAKARRAVAVAMDQQEKENKEGTEPPPDTAMGGTGVESAPEANFGAHESSPAR